MATTLDPTTTLDQKANELCQSIVDSPEFAASRAKIDAFMDDADAVDLYRAWQEKAQELHRMQHQGLDPDQSDLDEFGKLKSAVETNTVAADFLEAEDYLNSLFEGITRRIQKTLQLGHVPTSDDMADSGCCSSGGCGCH